MKRILLISTLSLMACSASGGGIDTNRWTCESLIPHVLDISRTREVQVLEITSPRVQNNTPGSDIKCWANAEWSQGTGMIEYGARVSEGDQVIVTYRQL